MSSSVIVIDRVWKLYHRQRQRTFKEMLPAFISGGKKNISDTFWALQDIDFEVKRGEAFGVIGPNGSGKSTLLKLIACVTRPTQGHITVEGRITPLIELGAGFHPEMTGRENIYLNATILGLTRKEIIPLEQKIIDFSEIADFIDQPVKHYSSGMYMRLAFSVAIHIPFDILLVDEILGVGDINFQQKCFALMEDFKRQGKTIVYVGHNLAQVKKFCDRAAYLEHGQIKYLGDPKQAVAQFAPATAKK